MEADAGSSRRFRLRVLCDELHESRFGIEVFLLFKECLGVLQQAFFDVPLIDEPEDTGQQEADNRGPRQQKHCRGAGNFLIFVSDRPTREAIGKRGKSTTLQLLFRFFSQLLPVCFRVEFRFVRRFVCHSLIPSVFFPYWLFDPAEDFCQPVPLVAGLLLPLNNSVSDSRKTCLSCCVNDDNPSLV
ncbi:MAG: hypothetical protein ACOVRM_12405, partial [Planctomycetaceae bacterium]